MARRARSRSDRGGLLGVDDRGRRQRRGQGRGKRAGEHGAASDGHAARSRICRRSGDEGRGFAPRLERPERAGAARRRGEHEGDRAFQRFGLPSVGGRLDAERQRGGVLAGEGDGGRPETAQLGMQRAGIHGLGAELVVRAVLGLVEIGQADSQGQQLGIAVGREPLRRQADGVQCRPEGVAGIGIVGARLERGRTGRGAAEHQVEARRQQVGDELLTVA